MKKAMIVSGAISAVVLSAGIMFKYLYMPGASFLMTVGLLSASLFFIPFMCLTRMKEKQKGADKLLWVLGSLSGMAMTLGILFKIMHWPGANIMGVSSVGILVLAFLPVHFFSGIGTPAGKTNTVISSVVLVLGCGLFLSLTSSPRGVRMSRIRLTQRYLRNEQLLANEQRQLARIDKAATGNSPAIELAGKIYQACEDMKTTLVEQETGYRKPGGDFEKKDALIGDGSVPGDFPDDVKMEELRQLITKYNVLNGQTALRMPSFTSGFLNTGENVGHYRSSEVLSDLVQMQLIALQDQQELAVAK